MKNLALALTLFIVAAISYGLGRRHGTRQAAGGSSNVEDAPATQKSAVRRSSRASGESGHIALDRGAPFTQNLSSAERGYQAARVNLDDALHQLEALSAVERMGFITGIFSFVAQNQAPADALKVYQRVPERFRSDALRALVGEWIYTRSPLDEDQRHLNRERAFSTSGSRLGLVIELTSMLASARPDAELTSAWLDAFSNHSNRSEMLLTLARNLGGNELETVLTHTEGWTPWEKERVTEHALANWSYKSPKEAWQWYQANQGRFETDLSSSILGPWASSDPDAVKGLLTSIQDPAQRKVAIEAIGKVLAGKNTDDAVAWANGFEDATDRLNANSAIYEGAPRGIGAVLKMENGYPTVNGIVPGSPLDGSGVQKGDQFLEIWESNGNRQTLYAKDLSTTVNLIRGEPGSQLTLRLLRHNQSSGQLEEHLVQVTRGQLYLNEKTLPDRFVPVQKP